MKQIIKSEIELGLSFMVPDLVYKFQMICLRVISVIEQKPEKFLFLGKSRAITPEWKKSQRPNLAYL